MALVPDASEKQAFSTRAAADITWVYRNDASQAQAAGSDALATKAPDNAGPLETAVRALQLPEGEGYVWAAGEAAPMRAIHRHLVEEKGLHKSRARVSSYWKSGAIAVHETVGKE